MEKRFEHFPRHSERGGAGVKIVILLVVVVLLAHAGYNYIPAAYDAENFKQELSTIVVQAVALPTGQGKPSEVVKRRIEHAAQKNNLPSDYVVDVKEQNSTLTARVYYVKKVPLLPFGIWDYDYVFDHTAAPHGFLTN